jgi:hypothetical protein
MMVVRAKATLGRARLARTRRGVIRCATRPAAPRIQFQ